MIYYLDVKDPSYLSSHDVDMHSEDSNPLSLNSNLDLMKIRYLQQQDTHISEIIDKCKSKKCEKTLYYLDEHSITYRKIKLDKIFFHMIMVLQTLQPFILYESHSKLGHNGSTRLYNFIKRHYYWRKLHQQCNKYIRSCPECPQVTLKEPLYVNLHLPILQFAMLSLA